MVASQGCSLTGVNEISDWSVNGQNICVRSTKSMGVHPVDSRHVQGVHYDGRFLYLTVKDPGRDLHAVHVLKLEGKPKTKFKRLRSTSVGKRFLNAKSNLNHLII